MLNTQHKTQEQDFTEDWPAMAATLKDLLRKKMEQEGYSLHRIAVEARVGSDWLGRWLATDGEHDWQSFPGFQEKLWGWLDGEPETEPEGGEVWADTPTALEIFSVLDYARVLPTIGVIYGGAGVGKTRALSRYARQHPETWLVTAAQHRKTTVSLLDAFLRAMGGSGGSAMRSGVLFDDILRRMARPHPDKGRCGRGLLIVDEAQHLDIREYDAFRAFFDEAAIGLVYAGNEYVWDRIRGARRASLPQVFSRVGRRLELAHPKPGDVDAILEAHGIGGREAREYAQRLAGQAGGLRNLQHVIQGARRALQPDEEMDAALLKAVARQLGVES